VDAAGDGEVSIGVYAGLFVDGRAAQDGRGGPTTRAISSRWIRDTLRAGGSKAVVEFVPAPVAEVLAAL
jgi:hypothetical protein